VLNTLEADKRNAIANIANVLTTEVEADFHIADCRYTFLHQLCQKLRRQEGGLSHSVSE
jgi:ferrous iron transport protein B